MSIFDRLPWETLTSAEVEAIALSLKKQPINLLAHDLGHFLLAWSHYETALSILLRSICQTTNALDYLMLAGQLDVYQKMRAAVSITSVWRAPLGWFEKLRGLQKRLDGPLREKRNRFVHDTWLVEDTELTRIHYRPRPLPSDGSSADMIDMSVVTHQEIRAVTAELVLSVNLLKNLQVEISSGAEH